ncbi:heparinase II/III domain-containing protein [Mucilaginibacter flavidus]|uniref:heparinase II/III domain-containing protein n=1 Tax=Mucilaginibacter flavidus TaxID=2949309 RepID=UPI0020930301|nr:heparinase II/III family protein [Mucilaginibacter flavidus]
MVKKSLLLFRTVRHLKLKQIIYQFYYRLKPRKNLASYKPNSVIGLTFNALRFTTAYELTGLAGANCSFTFLNLKKDFAGTINWDYQGYGKLWNYNLQYFNYLHQTDITVELKQQWLHDIGSWLNIGKLKLEPYPVALRAINTIRFLSTEKLSDPLIIEDLYGQLNYLNDNLEFHLLGNHLLENAFALFMGSSVFNNSTWAETSKRILYAELNEQILNDGGHFELSPMYHQIILFRVLELIDWYSKVEDYDCDFLKFVTSKAAEMLKWLELITFSNGDIPHFNDSADGIAFTSAELFAFARQLNIKPNETLQLNGSGYRKYVSPKYECVVDAGDVGPSYQPGHSHSDMLSFVLYSKGIPIIVDTGTSTYQIGTKRTYERSTNAHNTVELSGCNQSEVWGGFRVGRRAEIEITKDTETALTAGHNGYRKKNVANHERNFIFAGDVVSIIDVITGADELSLKALFHFYPNCKVEIQNPNKVFVNNIATIEFTGKNKLELQEYELANGYNKYLTATCLTVEFKKQLQTEITLL